MKTEQPPLQRTMYAITGRSGQFLINLAPDGPVFSPMPIEALRNRFAWMNSTVAAAKQQSLRANYPGVVFSIALLELEGTGPGQWAVRSTRSYDNGLTPQTQLIG